jgi:hypothetical protein
MRLCFLLRRFCAFQYLLALETLGRGGNVISRFVHQTHTEKSSPSSIAWSNPALNLAPFSRWALRDKAAQRRLALR